MRGIDKPPYAMPEANPNARREARRLREGIEYRVLYDREAVELPGKLADIQLSCEQGEKARILTDLPLKLWIADDTAALIPIRSGTYGIDAAFIVYPSALLDALLALFQLEWERATPLRFFSSAQMEARPGDGPDEIARTLLPLLTAGLTDEGIARSLADGSEQSRAWRRGSGSR